LAAAALAVLAVIALFATVRVGAGLGASANCRKPPGSPPASPPASSFARRLVSPPISQPVSPPLCPPATHPAGSPNICVTVNGKGILRAPGEAWFELNIRYESWKSTFDGSVTYRDPTAGLSFEATDFTVVKAPGDVASVFGFGTANGSPVRFLLELADRKPDNFALWLMTTGYRVSSPLAQGAIRLHHRC
jgi:hypothetical protein